jgi:hypothetical protein
MGEIISRRKGSRAMASWGRIIAPPYNFDQLSRLCNQFQKIRGAGLELCRVSLMSVSKALISHSRDIRATGERAQDRTQFHKGEG